MKILRNTLQTFNPFSLQLFKVVGLLSSWLLTGCLGGEGGSGFGDLVDGSTNNVSELTIEESLPDVESVVIEQNQNQTFIVSAKAPTGRNVVYQWILNGTPTGITGTTYSLTGESGTIGNHILLASVTDEVATKTRQWNVKVNGPPVVTPVTTGTPKVSVGSSITIASSATDPNNDTLTYTWKINGVTSSYLVGNGASAVLTGNAAIVGPVNISVEVSDGSASDSYTWTAEINHFPMACNTLTQGKICTYGGNPSVGDGESPAISNNQIRAGIIDMTVDVVSGVSNYFMADNENDIVWYWNRTSSAVTRLGVEIPAGQMRRVAGSGESGNGAEGVPSLESALNDPRGLYYNSASQTLYIADRENHLVRYVDSTGVVYNGLGSGSSNADGVTAFTADCNRPTGLSYYNNHLYVTCYDHDRVKRWNLSDNLVYNVLGTGADGYNTSSTTAPTSQAHQNPYGIFVNTDGVYVTAYSHRRVRFVNHSGVTKTFYVGGTQVAVNNNRSGTVLGSGSGNYDNAEKNPTALTMREPTGVYVHNDIIYTAAKYSNRDAIYVANDSGAPLTFAGTSVAVNKARRITSTATASYNGEDTDINQTRLTDPFGLLIDTNENKLIFAAYGNRRMRAADMTTWKVSTLVGSGWARYGFIGDTSKPTMEHQFNYPMDIVYDTSTRQVLFGDRNNVRIRSIDAYGNIETALGRGAGDPVVDNEVASNVLGRFNSDYSATDEMPGIAMFSDGQVVYSDRYILRGWNRGTSGSSIAQTYMDGGRVSTILGDYLNGADNSADGAATAHIVDRPNGVAAYGSGTGRIVFFADTRNHCIKSVDDNGNVDTIVGHVDGSNDCSDTAGNGVDFSSDPLGLALNTPVGVAVDANGNLYITDKSNHKVRFLNRGSTVVTIGTVTIQPGEIATVACTSGSGGSSAEGTFATAARCNEPTGVAVYGSKVCFSNSNHHNVRCFETSDGRISTVAGSPTASPAAGSPFSMDQEGVTATNARLRYPHGLAFDESGDLFIADSYNHIIRKVKLSP